MNQNQGVNLGDLSSGLLDGVEVTVTGAKFIMWDYEGKRPDLPKSPAAWVKVVDPEGKEHEQKYTIGKAEDWGISPDGDEIYRTKGTGKLSKSSNFGIFVDCLIDAGYPREKIGASISKILLGLKGVVMQYTPPKRNIKDQQPSAKDKSMVVFSKIMSLPGGSNAGAGADTLKADAAKVLTDILAKTPSVNAGAVIGLVFQATAGNQNQSQIIQLVSSSTFLSDPMYNGKVWMYDGTNLNKIA